MAFDKSTRNKLASFVGEARRLIANEFTQKFQSIYGVSGNGEITPVDQLGHLDDGGLATALLLRDRIGYLVNTHPDDKDGTKAAVERLAREQAFTILNRLAAIRMAEKRGLIVESVGKGYQSKGFKVFEQVAGSGLGDIYHRYRRYLFCLFDELAVDLGSLFDRQSPQALLFPREPALLALIDLINGSDIDSLWTEDETIGWIYQYYNDPAERKKMRDESSAPRNSRELAVRNQFFTPRYVVEFLTDNTLGRIWYEMTKGETSLKESCRYLVRRPTEIFLKPGEEVGSGRYAEGSRQYAEGSGRYAEGSRQYAEGSGQYAEGSRQYAEGSENLSQEELLKQPVNIPFRALKDPRELRMLDPACGSMHFGLYAFDLYERIYEEAWEMQWVVFSRLYAEDSRQKSSLGGTTDGGEKLSGSDCLAESDGIGGNDLQSDKGISERRDLRINQSGSSGSGFNSVEHCGRTGTNFTQGVSAFPFDSVRFTSGSGDSDSNSATYSVYGQGTDGSNNQPGSRSREVDKRTLKFALKEIECSRHNAVGSMLNADVLPSANCPLPTAAYCPLPTAYSSKEEFLRDVPRLIIEHNIHGIDIDPRAVQIAGLSLWLRAQRSWHSQRVKPADRPRITRSNIVCAEPMPGDKNMLREFTVNLEVPAFGYLVEQVFDKMQLAGEAGSLLKIEEEIRDIVAEAKRLWMTAQKPKLKQMGLFGEPSAKPEQAHLPLDFSGITDERFWEGAEEKLYQSLREYSEVAGEQGYQRRLFAEDAARGFAFIDVCRKRFDVVVMNPPFGELSSQYRDRARSAYPASYNDILATFVDRGGQMLVSCGLLGAITSRTCFFLSSFTKWRDEVVLGLLEPRLLLDLGLGVMDSAMVEAAAYVLEKTDASGGIADSVLTCFRLLNLAEPSMALLNEVDLIKTGLHGSFIFTVVPSSFRMVPNAPFAYWVSERIRKLFVELPPFEGNDRTAKIGASTKNDFRFLRLNWELPTEIKAIKIWYPFAKGGAHSPFYTDIHLQIKWCNNAEEIEAELLRKFPYLGSSAEFVLHRSHPHLHKGLTWPIKNRFTFKPWPLPEGCVFAHVGPSAFFTGSPAPFWGLMSASVFTSLLRLTAGWNIEVGVVQRTVVPHMSDVACQMLGSLANQGWVLQRAKDTANQTSHAFLKPTLARCSGTLQKQGGQWSERLTSHAAQLVAIQSQIDDIAFELYGINESDRKAMEVLLVVAEPAGENENVDCDEECVNLADSVDIKALTSELIDYSMGTVVGRWDIRFATGEKQAPELPDPFAPLPVCPPGMLQNSQGLPAEPKDVPADYPLRISWPGILVDDENHPENIVSRVREAIEVIWNEKQYAESSVQNAEQINTAYCQPPTAYSSKAEAIEAEACEILGVRSLRDYFAKPSGFFADHLKRYSKSRRQAPIYWPLSTAKCSYTLWIYYHRLTDQTLHVALADFVDPKLKAVRAEIAMLREAGNYPDKGGTRLEELLDLEKELADFHDEIERIIKLPWKPDLNDGVLITASPLWKLFRLPKWQKDLKACWEKLEKGEFDWAHLAYSIWPKRVEEACRKDRSIAIAHGREDLCLVEPPKSKKGKRGKKGAVQGELEEA